MSNIAIEIQNVSKRFRLYHDPISGPAKELLFFWKRKKYYRELMAVKNVSMNIEKGEIIGIIGPNGAGKTTLLKMIAGLLPIDHGKISVNGKVTALLALGVGVHPEFSGRENIYYGGMLLGMTKHEVLRKSHEIVEFSELGTFIDSPFRTYSSGMKARLLFAISMSIDPDILIVDEALATGDSYFVQKCSNRIQEICRSGATILYVSHNLEHVQEICNRAVLLDGGALVGEGAPATVIAQYRGRVFEKEKRHSLIVENQGLNMIGGTGEIVVTEMRIKNGEGEETTGFHTGEVMDIELSYECFNSSIREVNLFLGFLLCKDFSYVGEINTAEYMDARQMNTNSGPIRIGKRGVIVVSVNPILLLNNHYSLWVILYQKGRHYYCEYKNVKPFFVAKSTNPTLKGDALCWLPASISTRELVSST